MKQKSLAVVNFISDLINCIVLFQALVLIIVLSNRILTITQQVMCFVLAVIAVTWNEIIRRKEK
ncbi:hypothetical protein KVB92_09700 [Lentilactobacillus parabuchneri]|uniref:hypothetical protein n=1 Tax=Lentilactobacillus parabuchneri TaxID=152331 RepID=UPI00080B588A|nr:hypothetical protein [Lentilactobacillus parabuchneri]MBW0223478.1 hypothetical protein [Lentilactobacillus parabuchneri]OCB82637.1 hypothetical protein A7322_01260 [Lentilactobacillus parabuchneri]